MADLRQTRKKVKTVIGILLGVDLVAAVALFSPLIGSTNSRRQELNQLWADLQAKTRQAEPLRNMPHRVELAKDQISEFYSRFPSEYSQILTEFGKLAVSDGVTIEGVKYKPSDTDNSHLQLIEMDADLAGNYVSLAKFINALERDEMFFTIDSVELGGEQQGPVKLKIKLETYLKTGTP